jgi:hypothetical protein
MKRFILRILVLRVLLPILTLYVLSYISITRLSYHFNKKNGVNGFTYFPFPPKHFSNSTISRWNDAGYYFYYPLYKVDHGLLGGPDWVEPFWGISK